MDIRVCRSCRVEFDVNSLILTCEGFGCPRCGSVDYEASNNDGKGYKWEEVDVKYKEGPHD